MPLYMMQWNSKDVSFVLADDREKAALMLGAEGDATARDLVPVPHFKIRLAFDNIGVHIVPGMYDHMTAAMPHQ